MNITNDREVMIFRFDKDGRTNYTVGISKKLENGEYEKAFFPIQFNKGTEIEDRAKIKIRGAWLSFYNWNRDGKKGTTFFIKCNSFEDVEDGQAEKNNEEPYSDLKTSTKISDEPFADFGNQIELSPSDFNEDDSIAF